MSLNDTPCGERTHIAFFGRRNAGKSSLINAITGQDLSVVSPIRGTTTDPVRKSMELLPLGPVLLIDTPGYDDSGDLGELRVKKAREIMNETDLGILVIDGETGFSPEDRDIAGQFEKKNIPYLIVINKEDLTESGDRAFGDSFIKKENKTNIKTGTENDDPDKEDERIIRVSAVTGSHIEDLKERMGRFFPDRKLPLLAADLVLPGQIVILVIPIDKSAPRGRLILPQQQTIRDLLDAGAFPLCVRDRELPMLFDTLPEDPALVITDSQVFARVSEVVPDRVPLTSFSILMARYKGFLWPAVRGASMIDRLLDGDRVLIAEGCTHHRQCEDIGTVKLPRLLASYTGRKLEIETSSGRTFPEKLGDFALVIHCGACMLNLREMSHRLQEAEEAGVPFTNYGIAIAHMRGILKRSLEILR